MDISLIITTRSHEAELQATLESLVTVSRWLKGDGRRATCEIVIVNNEERKNGGVLNRDYSHPWMQVRLLTQPTRGKSYALNMGVEAATGEIFVFTDDDVRFTPDWLARLTNPIRDGKYDAVAGGARLAEHLREPWMTDIHYTYLASTERHRNGGTIPLAGLNMAVARKIFDAGFRFDIELGPGRAGFCEDTQLEYHLAAAGFSLAHRPDIEIIHYFDPRRLTRRAWRNRMYGEGKSLATLFRRHGGHRARRSLLFVWSALFRVLQNELTSLFWKATCTEAELKAWSNLGFHCVIIWRALRYWNELSDFKQNDKTADGKTTSSVRADVTR